MKHFHYFYVIKLLEHASLSVAFFRKIFFKCCYVAILKLRVKPPNKDFLSYSVHSIIRFIYIKHDLGLGSFPSEIWILQILLQGNLIQ